MLVYSMPLCAPAQGLAEIRLYLRSMLDGREAGGEATGAAPRSWSARVSGVVTSVKNRRRRPHSSASGVSKRSIQHRSAVCTKSCARKIDR